MDRTPLKSSVVASKGYNPLTQDMEIEFPDGTIGSFKGVTPDDSKWFEEECREGDVGVSQGRICV